MIYTAEFISYLYLETFQVGPDGENNSDHSLFFSYYIDERSVFQFDLPGLGREEVSFDMDANIWYQFKVEQENSGDQCTTKLFVNGNQIYDKSHTCGSYTHETTYVYATGHYLSATGYVKNIRFLWL